MLKKVLGVVLVVVVLGALLPVLLPLFFDTATDIETVASNATYAAYGAPVLGTMWPIMLTIIILGVAAGVIFYALRKFGVIGG